MQVVYLQIPANYVWQVEMAMAYDCISKANGYSRGPLPMPELGVTECARGQNIQSTSVEERPLPDHISDQMRSGPVGWEAGCQQYSDQDSKYHNQEYQMHLWRVPGVHGDLDW